jgi:hypothetical protein
MVHAQQLDADALAEEWPGWHVWRSTNRGIPSGWCATRKEPLTHDQAWAGMSRTLVEDTPEALVAELRRQSEIEGRP